MTGKACLWRAGKHGATLEKIDQVKFYISQASHFGNALTCTSQSLG